MIINNIKQHQRVVAEPGCPSVSKMAFWEFQNLDRFPGGSPWVFDRSGWITRPGKR